MDKEGREYIENSVEKTMQDLLLESLQSIIKNVSIGSCLITPIIGSKSIMLSAARLKISFHKSPSLGKKNIIKTLVFTESMEI